MNNPLEFQETVHKDWRVLTPVGRINTVTASDAEKTMQGALDNCSKLALDMSKLDYISSAGLRAILRLAKKAKKLKKQFVYCNARGMIKEVLEASGMDMLLTSCETIDELP